MKTYEMLVSGRVQGVGYRYFALMKANQYKITGSVMNLYDGRVKVVATGSESELESFVIQLKNGPSHSYVEEVLVNELPLEEHEKFRITY